MSETRIAVGIDIGGTKTAVGLVRDDGTIIARAEARTPSAAGADAVLATASMLATRIIADADEPVQAVGVGSAGVIEPAQRVVLSATDTLRGWAGTEIGRRLEVSLALPVAVDNDVRAHAVGEARHGAGRGRASALVIAAGTGVGGAFVLDGRPLTGAAGAAGHFGHIPSVEAQGLPCTCGGSGHLEMIAAGPAVLAAYQRARSASDGEPAGEKDTRDVFALAQAGDAVARTVIATAGRALGRAVGGLVNALDPEIVIIAGGLSGTSDLWWDPLRAGFTDETIDLVRRCPVVPAELGSDAAIVGAAMLALDDVGAKPQTASTGAFS
ncbi:ROK family protein [Microbacterium xylanilyticum]